MKIAELFEAKSFAPYFVMDISHEPGNKIQVHVLSTEHENDDYHIQVMVNDKTWEIINIESWDKDSAIDVKKDTQKIVDCVNDQFKKHSDLQPVKMTDKTKVK